MKIEASTQWGRIRMEFPDEMSREERAQVFEEMARMERAERRPLNFGDLRLKKSDGTSVAAKSLH